MTCLLTHGGLIILQVICVTHVLGIQMQMSYKVPGAGDVVPAVWHNVPKAEERSDEAGMLSCA